jgi:hypothetical protein
MHRIISKHKTLYGSIAYSTSSATSQRDCFGAVLLAMT